MPLGKVTGQILDYLIFNDCSLGLRSLRGRGDVRQGSAEIIVKRKKKRKNITPRKEKQNPIVFQAGLLPSAQIIINCGAQATVKRPGED